jgi:hypothetical protein
MGRKPSSDNSKSDKRRPKKGRSAWLKAQRAKARRRTGTTNKGRYLRLSPAPRLSSPTVLIAFVDVVNAKNNADHGGFILIWIRSHTAAGVSNEKAAYLSMHSFDLKNGKYSLDDVERGIKRATVSEKSGKAKP